MEIHAGTSGFSYKEWCGPFYPEGFPASEMLSYYAERLPAVEINNTFYRLPRESLLESWAAQVPESFRFVIKASRKITHIKRLKNAADETAYLLRVIGVLGARLGAILFQTPPNLACDLERLDGFLSLLPDGTRAAFEFRHPSWFDDAVTTRLRNRDFALAVVDDEDGPPPAITATASWGYFRLRRPGYGTGDLTGWLERISVQPWSHAYVFFKHEDAGAGPKMATELLSLGGEGLKRAPAVEERPSAKKAPDRRQVGSGS